MREQPGSCRMRVIRAGAHAQIRRAWCGPANWLTRSPACGSHKAAKAGRRDFTLPSLAFRSGAGLTGPKLIQLPPSHRLSRQGEAPLWSPVGAWADIRCDPPRPSSGLAVPTRPHLHHQLLLPRRIPPRALSTHHAYSDVSQPWQVPAESPGVPPEAQSVGLEGEISKYLCDPRPHDKKWRSSKSEFHF